MSHHAVYLGMPKPVGRRRQEEGILRDERDRLLAAQVVTPLKRIALGHRPMYAQEAAACQQG